MMLFQTLQEGIRFPVIKVLKSGNNAERKQDNRQTHHTLALFTNKTGGSVFKAFNMAS